jgi:hypothetical protein
LSEVCEPDDGCCGADVAGGCGVAGVAGVAVGTAAFVVTVLMRGAGS